MNIYLRQLSEIPDAERREDELCIVAQLLFKWGYTISRENEFALKIIKIPEEDVEKGEA